MDHVLSTVYSAAGLSDMSDFDKAVWLRSDEAATFCDGGRSILLFTVQIPLDAAFLGTVRGFKTDSSAISRKFAHRTNPVQVATALSNLLYKDTDDVVKLFKCLFHYSCGDLANKYEAELLTAEEEACLKKNFSSRS